MPTEELGDLEDAALVLGSSVSTSTSRLHYRVSDLIIAALKNIVFVDGELQGANIGQKREIARQRGNMGQLHPVDRMSTFG